MNMNINEILQFYKDKRVLVTGHTGFKGAWMMSVLNRCGAKVCGYALNPPTDPSLYDILGLSEVVNSVIGDIRDLPKLKKTFDEFRPEIVIHMAAQPIVRESYKDPVGTYETNVMGTVNIMECVRLTSSVVSFINVTTDKVYKNRERNEGYKEDEELNGYDPYSNSKSCSELVTDSYKKSFFIDEETGKSKLPDDRMVAISTMRAGNVIGGGDFAVDRIIPDCVRAAIKGEDIIVRNPYSIRPFQHVLEPVCMYLYTAMKQYEDNSLAGSYNIGPRDEDCWTTGEITTKFCECWGGVKWLNKHDGGPHEATFLKLNCAKIRDTFGWEPVWSVSDAIERIVEWSKAYENACIENEKRTKLDAHEMTNGAETMKEVIDITNKQIEEYLGI